jgi:hypothetical protein
VSTLIEVAVLLHEDYYHLIFPFFPAQTELPTSANPQEQLNRISALQQKLVHINLEMKLSENIVNRFDDWTMMLLYLLIAQSFFRLLTTLTLTQNLYQPPSDGDGDQTSTAGNKE